jgi:hypothetical protein
MGKYVPQELFQFTRFGDASVSATSSGHSSKNELRRVLKSRLLRSLYCSQLPYRGSRRALFQAACQHDLEGIIAKWKHGMYVSGRDEISKSKLFAWDGRREVFADQQAPPGRSTSDRVGPNQLIGKIREDAQLARTCGPAQSRFHPALDRLI